jgi:mannose-6-phosphate isomerase-like protein (cupin superfamily)
MLRLPLNESLKNTMVEANSQRIVPVVLCGGTGSRLWPLSREGYPKQFWPLVSAGTTMLQDTMARATGAGFSAPIIVCNQAHRFMVAEQLQEAGIANPSIVLEPVARNSAPAIAAAALLAHEADPNAVLWLMAADAAISDDAVLVMHRDRAQDVKTLLTQLKKAGRKEATEHRRAFRPWGHYEGLIQGDRFQVKKISVKPGAKLSLQKHFHRAEHWVVVNGTAIVERDAERILLRENESVYLPLGCVHRMENPGMIPLTLIEVQSGAYLGEDDIVRFEDTYGRT